MDTVDSEFGISFWTRTTDFSHSLLNVYVRKSTSYTHTHMTRMTGPDCAVMCNLINTWYTHTHTQLRHFTYECESIQSGPWSRLFGVTGDWKTAALDPGAWYNTVQEGGCRFMAAWVREEENASNQRQKKRDAEEADKVEVAPGVTVEA